MLNFGFQYELIIFILFFVFYFEVSGEKHGVYLGRIDFSPRNQRFS